jgi:hypothetical protein
MHLTSILLPWTGKTINIAYDRLELTFDHKQPFKISPEDCMFDESLFSIFIVFWYHNGIASLQHIAAERRSQEQPGLPLTSRKLNNIHFAIFFLSGSALAVT